MLVGEHPDESFEAADARVAGFHDDVRAVGRGTDDGPSRLTNHSRGALPCQLPTIARTVPETAQITSRACASPSAASLPSKSGCPTKTTTPAGGRSGSDVADAKASSHGGLVTEVRGDHSP